MGFRYNGVRRGRSTGYPSQPIGTTRKATDLEADGTFGENSGRSERHAAEGQRRQRREGALCESISIKKLGPSLDFGHQPVRTPLVKPLCAQLTSGWEDVTRESRQTDGLLDTIITNGKSRAENPIRFRSATESGASTARLKLRPGD